MRRHPPWQPSSFLPEDCDEFNDSCSCAHDFMTKGERAVWTRWGTIATFVVDFQVLLKQRGPILERTHPGEEASRLECVRSGPSINAAPWPDTCQCEKHATFSSSVLYQFSSLHFSPIQTLKGGLAGLAGRSCIPPLH